MAKDRHEISRRRFIGAGAAAGAGALATRGAPGAQAATRQRAGSTPRRADVIVVGAGFAGLSAARTIANAGMSVVVLEARNRVGGRVWAHELGGGEVSERGGTFIGPTQDRVKALADAYNVDTFPTYDTGNNAYINENDMRYTWSDTGQTGSAPPDPLLVPDLATVVTQLDDMSTNVPVDAPWTADSAEDWDAQTLETWLKANTVNPNFARVAGALASRPIFGAEPRELSLLFVLFYIASSGNETNPGTFERNFDTRGGAQESRLVGGSQLIVERIAQELGRRVALNTPVRRIIHTSSGVTVVSDRVTYSGKHVIIAMPPTLAGRIRYEPLLPFQRDQLTQRLGQGTMVKVAATYPTPFWRGAGLTGQGLHATGLVTATFDDSPPDGTPGVIFGFVGGDKARAYALLSESDRRTQVLQEFADLFDDDAFNSPTDFFETSWVNEEWSRGCPVGIAGPGTLLAYGDRLRAPVGRIHWAGTETSDYWNGYMDGAVRSGERAAAEILP